MREAAIRFNEAGAVVLGVTGDIKGKQVLEANPGEIFKIAFIGGLWGRRLKDQDCFDSCNDA